MYAPEAGPSSAGKKRKAAVKGGKGSKGKGKRKAEAEGGAAEGGEEGGAGASGSTAAAANAAADSAAAALRRELRARFSQATQELQYVGLIKPAKRRRGDYVQRWVARVGRLLGEQGLRLWRWVVCMAQPTACSRCRSRESVL